MTVSIGFVGLGEMGSRMVDRMLASGYELIVFDVDQERLRSSREHGAIAARSLREVADRTEIVLVSLPSSDAVESVALGHDGLVHGDKIKTYVDMSTCGPETATKVASALNDHGIAVLDAPVSGGTRGASEGTLSIIVAGNLETLSANEALFRCLGNRVIYVGASPGQAQTVKVLNNLLEATALAVTSEVMVAGSKAGIAASIMLEVFNSSSGRNSATEDIFPNSVVPRTFDEGFSLGLAHKDVRLCMAMSRGLDVPMFVGGVVEQMFACTLSEMGYGADFSVVTKMYEHWAKTEVR